MGRDDRERVRAKLTECLSAHPEILEAYLFGSFARGEPGPHSDIDVAVRVEPDALQYAPFGYTASLTAELATAVGHDAVDVVLLNRAPPLLYHRVLRDGLRLLSRDLSATTTREAQALSRYCDYVPHLRKLEAAHRARIDGGSFGR